MGLITTQVAGFGSPKPKAQQAADPKPVRGFNWLGIPMKEGDYYGGRPEHMAPEAEPAKPGLPVDHPVRRQMARAKAIAQHAKERAEGLPSGEGWARVKKPRKKWHWTAEMRARARERALAVLERQRAEMKKANPETESG